MPAAATAPAVARRDLLPYEDRLTRDWEFAMDQGGRHFGGASDVFATLRGIADRLTKLGVDYAVVGGMAVFRHGLPRFTEDVDVLVTPDGHREIMANLRGRGYLPPFEKSKNLRDTATNVRVEFLLSGRYPGDGKPGPIAFPDPAAVSEEFDGVRYATLPALLELKIAAAMSAPDRPKDFGDVAELIRRRDLPRDLSDRLHPHVRPDYLRLWDAVAASRERDEPG